MTLFDCIQGGMDAQEEGKSLIDRKRGKEAQALFNDLAKKYRRSMSDDAANRLAAQDTKRIMGQKLASKKRSVAKDISDMRRLQKNVLEHRNKNGELDPAEALVELVANTGKGKFADVYNTQKAVRRHLFHGLNAFMARHSKSLLGNTREKGLLLNVHKELMGEGTGDKTSAAMARAIRDAYEEARLMFNAAGGDIPKLENWTPQIWRRQAFRAGGADEFADDLMERLDWSRIEDPLTGRPFGEGNASRDFVLASFESIRTGGVNRSKPSLAKKGRALANQHQEKRQLHFKSAGDWMAVAEKYGSPDLMDATIGYLENMSRDIAQMRNLGRNPKAALEFAAQTAELAATGMSDEMIAKVNRKASLARNVLANYNGDLSVAHHEFGANFFSGVRNVLSSAYLGGAVMSSITDNVTLVKATQHLGGSGTKTLSRVVSSMTSEASKADLARMVGVLDTAMETSAAMTKYMGEAVGPELTRRMASFVIRAQGLAHLTDINRGAFQVEIMGVLAEQSGKAFADINPNLRKTLELSGITPEDWDLIRSTPQFEGQSGGTFLVPRDILDRTDLSPEKAQELHLNLQNMLEREVEYAVPSRDIVTETSALFGTQRGTVPGELLRGGLQFKSFGISLTMGMIRRTQSIETIGGKASYVVTQVAGLTVMGALALQLKNVVKGKEPDDMDTDEFWWRALLQGGGLGILGDFAVAETNRYGGNVQETILGPQLGLVSSLGDLTLNNAKQLYQGKDTKFTKEATDLVKRNLPGGNLWQIRLVLERAVFDQVQLMLDPDAPKYLREKERRAKKETGTGYWWAPGDILPE